jgi:hypothetical protein
MKRDRAGCGFIPTMMIGARRDGYRDTIILMELSANPHHTIP